jgi:hypothetical protein
MLPVPLFVMLFAIFPVLDCKPVSEHDTRRIVENLIHYLHEMKI